MTFLLICYASSDSVWLIQEITQITQRYGLLISNSNSEEPIDKLRSSSLIEHAPRWRRRAFDFFGPQFPVCPSTSLLPRCFGAAPCRTHFTKRADDLVNRSTATPSVSLFPLGDYAARFCESEAEKRLRDGGRY